MKAGPVTRTFNDLEGETSSFELGEQLVALLAGV
ncbi:hypothetical protein Pla52n_58520 [Stieleria varia]|uniref:Uncharacterized protein n=1 Tax=Stieleria varia TaxID=2528005 RepID=A0A5C6A1D9_9BACT|nr:hypothetical protein Pla52n_58520 [Stieleria varia]